MKKFLCGLAFFCGFAFASDKLIVAASPVPHADILKFVKPMLAKQGIDLVVQEYSDYIMPNRVLTDKKVDANYFQTIPYMNDYNKNAKTNIVMLNLIHIEPMSLYVSPKNKEITKKSYLTEIKKGATIGIPNDPSNEARALFILSQSGIISLNTSVDVNRLTPKNIINTKYSIKFKELDASMLPRTLQANSLDLAVINANFAISAGLNPVKNSIFIESKDSQYANGISVLAENKNSPKVVKLINALRSPEVKEYINTKYNGQIVPAF